MRDLGRGAQGKVIEPPSGRERWITLEEALQVEVRPKQERLRCKHKNGRIILGPTPGGWPWICLDCGARAR